METKRQALRQDLRVYGFTHLRNGRDRKPLNSYTRKLGVCGTSGQAMVELAVFVPFLVFMCAAAIAVAYMCFQGVKVQTAANYAARIQGQERVAGGNTVDSIDKVNGTRGGTFDEDPTTKQTAEAANDKSAPDSNDGSVYARYRTAVRNMFGTGEQGHLFVPRPQIGNEIDKVKVVRIMSPPSVMGFNIQPVTVQASAYGGEDTNMYALPRFGDTAGSQGQGHYYWQQPSVLGKGNDNQPSAL